MKDIVTTPTGIGTTLAAGVATAGIGAVVAVAGGGFLKALKATLNAKNTDESVRAAVRKGVSSNKEIVDELKKMTGGGSSNSGKIEEIAKKMSGSGEEHKEEKH